MRTYTWSAGHARHLERITRRDGALRLRTLPARFGIVEHPAGPVVFDTGYHPSLRHRLRGAHRAYHHVVPWSCPPEQRLGARLAGLGYQASDVQLVVLSHLHADHIAGLVDVPEVPVVLSRHAWRAMNHTPRLKLASKGYFHELLPADLGSRLQLVDPPSPSDDLAHSALDLLGDGSLGLVALPGHAPGQLGLWVRPDQGPQVLFVADATFSLQAVHAGATPSRLFMALAFDDIAATRRTLGRIRAWSAADPELRLIGCHAWEGPADGLIA